MAYDGHISEHDLERHMLGMVKDETVLAALDEDLLVCSECIDAADETRQHMRTMRTALASGKARAKKAKARTAKTRGN